MKIDELNYKRESFLFINCLPPDYLSNPFHYARWNGFCFFFSLSFFMYLLILAAFFSSIEPSTTSTLDHRAGLKELVSMKYTVSKNNYLVKDEICRA